MAFTFGFNKRRERREQRERDTYREQWPAANDRIEELAAQSTPLNDWFAEGRTVYPEKVLEYVAALERRIARLEP